MARETYRMINGECVLIYSDAPDFVPPVIERGADGAPMVITDSMNPTECPADGRVYDSKSRYYAAVKAQGLEILGSEKLKVKKPDSRPQIRGAIERTLQQMGMK